MIQEYNYILAFLIGGAIFVAIGLTMARLMRPQRTNPHKQLPYECGEFTIGSSWVQYNVRFYLFAVIFVIFDVEVAFLVPWAVAYRTLDVTALVEMVVFLAILAVALIYAWRKGALKWV